MASQSQDMFQTVKESVDSQNAIATVECKPDPTPRSLEVCDSGLGSSLAEQSVRTDISGGRFEQSHIGDRTQNLTRNDTRTLTQIENQINHIHYHSNEGPESKRLKTDNKDGTQTPRTGKLQFLNSISADTSKRLHKTKKIYRGEKKTATGPIAVAVKILDSSAMSKKEVKSLQKVDCHPNVVRIHDSNIHWEGEIECIYIAMELCSKETLNDYVKCRGGQFDLQLAISHCTQLISGLKYIHEQGICHHDIKPHNILFSLKRDESASYDKVKMTDFGFSKRFQTDSSVTQSTKQGAGTKGYMAPEVLNLMEMHDEHEKKEAAEKITCKIDVFSIALVLCFCLSKGDHPFGKTTNQQDANIEAGKEPDLSKIQINGEIEVKVKDLLKRMLQHNPDNRPTMAEVWEEWQSLMTILGQVEEIRRLDHLLIQDLTPQDNEENLEEQEEGDTEVPRPSILLFERRIYNQQICSLYCIQPGNEAEESEVVPLPDSISRQTHTAVVLGQKIYALMWMKYVFVLDMDNLNAGWKEVYSTEHLHGEYPPAVALTDKIYVCGGGWRNGGDFYRTGEKLPVASSTCEVYDPSEGPKWKQIARMQKERGRNSVVYLDDHLYSIGGWDVRCAPLKSVERLDPGSERWEFVTEMNKARCNASAAILKNKIYVLGGEAQHSIEAFNPCSKVWTLLSFKLPALDISLSAVTLCDKLYAVGGREVYLVDMERKDCKKQRRMNWSINRKATLALS